ncbi:hypothetical protein N7495_003452 [Penicillium taxi]|uniref:uncharacterized protein n=1 Tax=Penicillium taxi TaxID=168475 RepID=UPI0025456B73|nr:uncharacterized protein N7495_003452 [Penicillium taxi]KAJ5902924.1 hypothetical protein N7495_003452 [Penicillium taxi]
MDSMQDLAMKVLAQPYINWDNEVLELERPIPASPKSPSTNKTLVSRLMESSRHPWGVTDYNLYLAAIEKDHNTKTRTMEIFFLEKYGFKRISLTELFDRRTFDHVATGANPIITFIQLPLLYIGTDEPSEQKLVLGLNMKAQHLVGYFFEQAPDELADLSDVWHEGQLIIDVHFERFLEMSNYTLEGHLDILGVGIFSYFRETKREFKTGMDLVVVIQFLQFLNDFYELLFRNTPDFRDRHVSYEEKLRQILSKSSYDSWFAIKNELTFQQYREQKVNETIPCDIFYDRAPN